MSEVQAMKATDVAALAELLRADAMADEREIVARADPGATAPLSFAQQRLWFLHQFDPTDAAYNSARAFRLRGDPDIDALESAFRSLIARHPALRIRVLDGQEGPRQAVALDAPFAIERMEPVSRDDLDTWARAAAAEPFDLGAPPFLRVRLAPFQDGGWVLLIVLHHIVVDAWSAELIIDDLERAYAAALCGAPEEIVPSSRIDIVDHALWQRARFSGAEGDKAVRRWRKRFGDDMPAALALPTDRPRGQARREAGRVGRRLPPDLVADIRAFCRRERCTPFSVLLAAWQVLLGRLSGQEDFAVGVPAATRDQVETHDVVGFFVNTQVFRVRLNPAQSLRDLCRCVHGDAMAALVDANLPFELLLEGFGVGRGAGRTPLFQSLFNFRARRDARLLSLQGLAVEKIDLQPLAPQFELTLDVAAEGDKVDLELEYDASLFDRTTIEGWAGAFAELLGDLLSSSDVAIGSFSHLRGEALSQALDQGRPGWTAEPDDRLVRERIAAWAAADPERPAIRFGDRTVSRGELDRRANRIAAALVAAGVGAEHRVGVAIERSPDLIAVFIGVLKANAAFLPLPLDWPQERIAVALEDADARIVLARPHSAARLDGLASRLLIVDEDIPDGADEPPSLGRPHPDSLAYVLYTSGSTGRPKGVAVAHGPLAMHSAAAAQAFGLSEATRELHMLSFAFDAAHERWLGVLGAGGTIVLKDEELWAPERTLAEIARHGVTNADLPPAYLAAMAAHAASNRADAPEGVAYSFGGEATSKANFELIRDALRPRALINGYGPTETVMTPLVWRAEGADGFASAYAPIGRPVGERRAYVLDGALQLAGQGTVGELYIGGEGLARGYVGRPGATAERFLPDPFGEPGGRMYRTGDLVRRGAAGELLFIGRADEQLKIRGYRIEPGEIEAALLAEPGVKEAVALAVEAPGAPRLVAYVAGEVLSDDLTEALKRRLPDYMVPSRVVVLDALPRLGGGKVDRRGLPAIDWSDEGAGHDAPEGEVETALAEIWAETLGLDRVGAADNFFALGGDSILSLQVVTRARARGLGITPRQIFERQTIRGLAGVATPVEVNKPAAKAEGEAILTPIQRWFFAQPIANRAHWNQSVTLASSAPVDERALAAALNAIVERHDALRLRFRAEGDDWRQEYATHDPKAEVLAVRDVDGDEALSALCAELQTGLDLANGPLLRAALARFADGRSQLLIVIHHLVVDSVSWRILLEDLDRFYGQVRTGQTMELGPQSAPFAVWGARLAAAARSVELKGELAFWRDAASGARAFPPKRPDGADRIREAIVHRVSFDRAASERLTNAPSAVRARLDDLILAALARTLASRSGAEAMTIAVEGHGRDGALAEGADIARTVGWFTSVRPMRLAPGAGGPLASLKSVKEQTRAVPGRGVGYGALRWMGSDAVRTELAALPEPDLLFNYLGRLDNSGPSFDSFSLMGLSAGEDRDPGAGLGAELTINARMLDGELSLDFVAAATRHDAADVVALADSVRHQIELIADACCGEAAEGLTPSDVALAGLDQQALDALAARLPTPPAAIEDIYPLSPMQEGMLFHGIEEPELYVTQTMVAADGLDHERFEAAWRAAAARHAALRTGFVHQGLDRPLQFVVRDVASPVELLDWRGRDADVEAALRELGEAERRRGFDLLRPSLLRAVLVRLGGGRTRIVLTTHHLILDGWSTSRLIGEVLVRYDGRQVPSAGGRFRDHVAWLESRDADASAAAWRQRLAPLGEPTSLSGALARPDEQNRLGFGALRRVLEPEAAVRLKTFAREQHVTLNTLVQGGWSLLLSRLTGERTVAFGATVSGRSSDAPDADTALGLFINTVAQVETIDPARPVGEWLRASQAATASLREHEHTPLHAVQSLAGRPGEALFDTLVAFENYPVAEALKDRAPDGLVLEALSNLETTNYPLAITVAEKNGGVEFGWTFKRDAFDDATVAGLDARLKRTLAAMAADAGTPLGRIDMLDAAEHAALAAANDTAKAYGRETSVLELVEARIVAAPDAPAVTFGPDTLSYRDLGRRADRLAQRLRTMGAGPDHVIGVALERSLELVVALLGIMKAGAAWLPLDPEHPAARLAEMAEAAGARIVLSVSTLAAALTQADGVRIVPLDRPDDSPQPGGPNGARSALDGLSLAYVIFTSGSTGRPKGVGNSHAGLLNRINWMQERYQLTPHDAVLQKTPFGFDVSVWEFFWPLVVGARLVVAPPGAHRDPAALGALIRDERVTTLHFVPTMLAAFVASGELGRCPSLTRIMASGEALPPDLAKAALAQTGAELNNLYGPTEAAIDVTHWTCSGDDRLTPIGRPIANTAIRILDADSNLAPPGAAGELAIAGANLARGYLGRPGLTAERFAPDPYGAPGDRLYLTGDLARLDPSGAIHYLDRIDRQLKLRGMRVEPAEIEAELRRLPGVRDAAVLPWNDALIAYVAAGDGTPDEAETRAILGERLPAHMVPARAFFVAELPVNANGKLDRAALPNPDCAAGGDDPPQGPIERAVADVWEDVLGATGLGRNDDFFQRGGHSLLAMRVVSRVRNDLGAELPVSALFEARTLAAFAARVERMSRPDDDLAAMNDLLDELEVAK